MCCKNTNAKETHFGACCSRPDLYGIINSESWLPPQTAFLWEKFSFQDCLRRG